MRGKRAPSSLVSSGGFFHDPSCTTPTGKFSAVPDLRDQVWVSRIFLNFLTPALHLPPGCHHGREGANVILRVPTGAALPLHNYQLARLPSDALSHLIPERSLDHHTLERGH